MLTEADSINAIKATDVLRSSGNFALRHSKSIKKEYLSRAWLRGGISSSEENILAMRRVSRNSVTRNCNAQGVGFRLQDLVYVTSQSQNNVRKSALHRALTHCSVSMSLNSIQHIMAAVTKYLRPGHL